MEAVPYCRQNLHGPADDRRFTSPKLNRGHCTLIGRDGDEIITADELASVYGTIGYEVVCGISSVCREFID